jgi:hypothetical protein
MLFRRAVIWFLIFVFVFVSLPVFLFYGISNTFLKESFYSGSAAESAYQLIVNLTADKMLAADKLLQEKYNQETVRAEIRNVYTLPMFVKVAADFGKQVGGLRENPQKVLVVSMKQYRDSLLTVVNKLAYRVVKEISICKPGELPQVNVSLLPTCVMSDVSYEQVAAPLSAQFEATTYMIPIKEQIQVDLNASVGQSGMTIAMLYSSVEKIKLILYAVLIFVLAMIGLLSYRTLGALVKYEGTVFMIGGAMGYLLSFGLLTVPMVIVDDLKIQVAKVDVVRFLGDIMGLVSVECQKVSLIFFALGAILLLLSFFVSKKHDDIEYVN